jgi:hypothetical protein
MHAVGCGEAKPVLIRKATEDTAGHGTLSLCFELLGLSPTFRGLHNEQWLSDLLIAKLLLALNSSHRRVGRLYA